MISNSKYVFICAKRRALRHKSICLQCSQLVEPSARLSSSVQSGSMTGINIAVSLKWLDGCIKTSIRLQRITASKLILHQSAGQPSASMEEHPLISSYICHHVTCVSGVTSQVAPAVIVKAVSNAQLLPVSLHQNSTELPRSYDANKTVTLPHV